MVRGEISSKAFYKSPNRDIGCYTMAPLLSMTGFCGQVQNPQLDPFKIRAGARRDSSVSTEDGFGLSIEIFFFISESLVFSQNRVPGHTTPHLASARPLMNGCVRYWKQ
jgi:hypothetical protein